MTKAEYEKELSKMLESGFEKSPKRLLIDLLRAKYIASLESENARLEKALNIAGRHIVEHENMCPWNVVDGYVADECSECIANDNAIKPECWKAAFIKEATDETKNM